MRRLVVIAALAMSVPAAALAQQNPACGSTITESITLTSDLSCSGTALILAGTNVTLDLAGHTVSSEFLGNCPTIPCATIEIPQGGATVRSGRIVRTGTGTTAGAIFCNCRGTFQDLAVEGGALGVYDPSSITNSTFTGGAYVRCLDTGLGIENSAFVGPGAVAISARICALRVAHNTFSGVAAAISSTDAYYPQVVTDNSIEGGGISIEGTTYYQTGSGEVSRNLVRSAPSDGISIFDTNGASVRAVVSDNIVIGSGADGIHIDDNNSGGVTVTGNLALGNLTLGINAPNAIDSGGNRGGGNGDPLECVGVVCSSDLSSDLAMCIDEQTQCESALDMCNATVIGTNGDLNGDGEANVVDITIFRRWIAGYPVP